MSKSWVPTFWVGGSHWSCSVIIQLIEVISKTNHTSRPYLKGCDDIVPVSSLLHFLTKEYTVRICSSFAKIK
jgi:hypothetical protein